MFKDFNPINLNRHDRRAARKVREPLFQCFVENRDGALIAVGPRMMKQACEQFITAINLKIGDGKEKDWSNPHIVQAHALN